MGLFRVSPMEPLLFFVRVEGIGVVVDVLRRFLNLFSSTAPSLGRFPLMGRWEMEVIGEGAVSRVSLVPLPKGFSAGERLPRLGVLPPFPRPCIKSGGGIAVGDRLTGKGVNLGWQSAVANR